MAKLGNASDDVNTRRVIAGVENLFQIIESPDFHRVLHSGERQRGLNLLSLDGGGVKGLFSLMVLEKILDEVETRSHPGTPRRLPCEYFDLIGGTSTGGLISIMLGRLRMDIKTCIQTYRALSTTIFSTPGGVMTLLNSGRQLVGTFTGDPWYSGETLKGAICETVDKQLSVQEREEMEVAGLSAEDVRLVSPEAPVSRCMVCAICEGHHKAARIRSYLPRKRENRDTSSYKIWEAARATSAAPIYFPAMEINDHRYFDGGMDCNNPILEVVDEAKDEFPGAHIVSIVSVGTGKGKVVEPHGGLINVVYAVLHRLTNTEAQHEEFMRREEFEYFKSSYFRFQADNNLGIIDLAAVDKMDEIASITKHYLEDEEVKRSIVRCAERIRSSQRF
jgi:predicted acylesterase/phospholipase RssA